MYLFYSQQSQSSGVKQAAVEIEKGAEVARARRQPE